MSSDNFAIAFAYLLFPVISIIGMFFISTFTKEKDLFRISWDKLAQFIAFLTVLFVLRMYIHSFMMDMELVNEYPILPREVSAHLWSFGLVFWEDFFFAVPLYYIWKNMKTKWLQVTLTVMISILFALGHAYQGWQGVVITAFLPYFISYHFGKKYGFGTSMLGHILYDTSTAIMVIMLPYLIG